MKVIKKINVKASCRFAEIKAKIVLSSDELIVTSDTTDSALVNFASICG